MVLHYTKFIECLTNCPIPIGFGKSGTGKTNALRCGLGLLGAHDFRFYHHLSAAKALQLCSITNIPLGLDDPDSKSGFSSLLIDFFNSAKKSTISSGDVKPISSIVVSTNFVPHQDMRYSVMHLVYECLLIPVHDCLLQIYV